VDEKLSLPTRRNLEALTRQRPFTGTTYHELLTNMLQGGYRLPAQSAGAARLDQVLRRCLAKDPGARFNSAAEFQAHLIPALKGYPSLAAPSAPDRDADTLILNQ
jgi:serine/threonine protein kinase